MDDTRGASDASATEIDATASEANGAPAAATRRLITEDWAATILGLALLALCLLGVIGKGMVP